MYPWYILVDLDASVALPDAPWRRFVVRCVCFVARGAIRLKTQNFAKCDDVYRCLILWRDIGDCFRIFQAEKCWRFYINFFCIHCFRNRKIKKYRKILENTCKIFDTPTAHAMGFLEDFSVKIWYNIHGIVRCRATTNGRRLARLRDCLGELRSFFVTSALPRRA